MLTKFGTSDEIGSVFILWLICLLEEFSHYIILNCYFNVSSRATEIAEKNVFPSNLIIETKNIIKPNVWFQLEKNALQEAWP